MSTANLSLYNLEATLMRLMFEREELAAEGLSVIEKDIEIREYVSKEIRKVDGVAYYLKEFEARATAAKEEAKRLKARADAWEQRHERLETLVKSVMLMSGKARLDGDSNTLRLVKCPASVEIAQPELVPAEYCKLTVSMPVELWKLILVALENDGLGSTHALAEIGELPEPKTEPVKSKIAEALKRGDGVPGCSLVTYKMSLRVE
jgi:hypothetical protein